MAGDPIVRVTTRTLTDSQIQGIYIKAGARDDQRLLNIALAAMNEIGDTPARKVIVSELNKQRAWLASRLGVDLIDAEKES